MHSVWNSWTVLYLALALTALGLSAWRRWNEAWTGSLILLASWAMTNSVGASLAPQKLFLLYFAFDCVAVEILVFRLLRRTWRWQVLFILALFAQLATHLWYWSYEPPPRRYHEILNAFFWVQFFAVAGAAFGRRPVPRPWLKPRQTYPEKVWRLGGWSEVPDRQPAMCPPILRAWA